MHHPTCRHAPTLELKDGDLYGAGLVLRVSRDAPRLCLVCKPHSALLPEPVSLFQNEPYGHCNDAPAFLQDGPHDPDGSATCRQPMTWRLGEA